MVGLKASNMVFHREIVRNRSCKHSMSLRLQAELEVKGQCKMIFLQTSRQEERQHQSRVNYRAKVFSRRK